MPNLDIIYDVTTEVTCDERKTNKQVIYQTTSLPSFVTFDAFYFCLWPKTLSFERYLGGKALATDHRGNSIKHPKVELTIQICTSNSCHYSCPLSEYCRSIVFLLVV